jgi:hypothetical protein
MPNTYTLLETITVGAAGAASVTFNSIPQTGYTDLVIKVSARTTRTGFVNDSLLVRFNGSTTGYSYRSVYGFAGSAGSVSGSNNQATYALDAPSATANTFSNGELYVPNYTSSNFKSVSVDSVSEDNSASTPIAELRAFLWSNTAAITSVGLFPETGPLFAQHSTFSLYGVSALGVTPTRAPKATGGSIIQTDGTYWYHAFLSSGTFTPATALTCDYLVVAGGGGGGDGINLVSQGGGGGAGGLRSTVTATGGGGSLESALSLASGTAYTVTIGAGGASNAPGSNSVFSTITSSGGGRGKGTSLLADGGSGGGGNNASTAGGTGTANQGFNGGAYNGGINTAGGGGGAGAVGVTNGGAGVAISAFATTTGTGVSNYYAGGGGGCGGSPGTGGAGGGGNGGAITSAGSSATANTGSGGGGGGSNTNNPGGAGGSGIVIVRYLAA